MMLLKITLPIGVAGPFNPQKYNHKTLTSPLLLQPQSMSPML
jgi:hypothetical protein